MLYEYRWKIPLTPFSRGNSVISNSSRGLIPFSENHCALIPIWEGEAPAKPFRFMHNEIMKLVLVIRSFSRENVIFPLEKGVRGIFECRNWYKEGEA